MHGQKVYWRVLIFKHGDLYLHHLEVTCADGAAVLLKLKMKVNASRSLWKKLVPFLVPVVYMATISPVSTPLKAGKECLVFHRGPGNLSDGCI